MAPPKLPKTKFNSTKNQLLRRRSRPRGGINVALIQTAKTSLSDAQIKALTVTPVTVLPAPSAGKINFVISAFVHVKSVAPYSNFGLSASMSLKYPGMQVFNSLAVASSVDGPLSAGINQSLQLVQGSMGAGEPDSVVVNTPVQVAIDNGGAGALTGGNGANSMDVTVMYVQIPA